MKGVPAAGRPSRPPRTRAAARPRPCRAVRESRGQGRAGRQGGDLSQRGGVGLLAEVERHAGGHDHRGLVRVEAVRDEPIPPRSLSSKSTGTRRSQSAHRNPVRSAGAASRPAARAGQPRRHGGATQPRAVAGRRCRARRPESRTAPTPLPAAPSRGPRRSEPGRRCRPGTTSCPPDPCPVGAASRRRAPPTEADLVLEDVRRRVDLDMHGPPQRHAHGGPFRSSLVPSSAMGSCSSSSASPVAGATRAAARATPPIWAGTGSGCPAQEGSHWNRSRRRRDVNVMAASEKGRAGHECPPCPNTVTSSGVANPFGVRSRRRFQRAGSQSVQPGRRAPIGQREQRGDGHARRHLQRTLLERPARPAPE